MLSLFNTLDEQNERMIVDIDSNHLSNLYTICTVELMIL